MPTPSMDSRFGAIVLCGGRSSRMGRDKAWLPWGPNATLLQHVVTVLEQVVPTREIVVVAGSARPTPKLPRFVRVVNESHSEGPLLALAGGLALLRKPVTAAFACGCDAPLLTPAFVRLMFSLLEERDDVLVPADDTRRYPLAAVYRKESDNIMLSAYKAGERSLQRVLNAGTLAVRELATSRLEIADPTLDSLANCNTQEDYETALRKAGFAD